MSCRPPFTAVLVKQIFRRGTQRFADTCGINIMIEEELFNQALGYPPEERPAFLAGKCGEDVALRNRVESLLRAHENPGDFPPVKSGDAGKTTVVYDPAKNDPRLAEPCGQTFDPEMIELNLKEPLGQTIGPYKVLQQIGQGGFGTVFMAEQSVPVRRKVALKILKPGMDSREIIARFEAERQALAMMNHSNIAKIFDGGTTDSGHPYFVMELVKGIPITEYGNEAGLLIEDRLALFVDLCRAVQHAHQKGIIHRDLKPSNVLVTEQDGRAIVKVIDFGIAKALEQPLTDKTVFTAYGQLIGTPVYMSPEQVALSAVDVDTRSDVYSLGVMLYELITGTTPFDKTTLSEAGFDGMRRMIRDQEPPRPSVRMTTITAEAHPSPTDRRTIHQRRLNEAVRGELDWIVMKALDKDRNRRYESASALAADIERYLRHEPVEACPPSLIYRLRKFSQRNKALVTTTILVSLAIVVGVAVSAWQAIAATQARRLADDRLIEAKDLLRREDFALREARKERDRARQYAEHARQLLYVGDMRLASQSWQQNDVARMRELLSRHVPQEGAADLRGFEWNFLSSQTRIPSQEVFRSDRPLHFVQYSPDGQLVAAAGADGQIRLFDAATLNPITVYSAGQGEVNGLDFSPDSTTLASTGDDGTVLLWDLRNRAERLRFRAHDKNAFQAVFAQGGRLLVTCGSDAVIRLWDLADGSPRGELKHHTHTVEAIALSMSGVLAAVSRDGDGSLWDIEKQLRIGSLALTPKSVFNAVAFSPSGLFIAAGQENGMFSLRRSGDASLMVCQTLPDAIQSLAFSPATSDLSHWVAVGTRSGSIHLLPVDIDHAANGIIPSSTQLQRGRKWNAHESRVYSLAFNPSGARLLTAGEDGLLKVWSLDSPQISKAKPKIAGDFALLDNDELVVCGKSLSICSLSAGNIVRDLPCPPNDWYSVRYAPLVKTVYALDRAGRVFSWQLHDSVQTLVWQPKAGEMGVKLDVSPDGVSLVTEVRSLDGTQRNLEFRHGSKAVRVPCNVVYALAHSPDGQFFASNYEKEIRIVEAASGTIVNTLSGHRTTVNDLSFSPDGVHLASVSEDRTVKVWDWQTGRQVWSEIAHANSSEHVAFSPDGQTLATTGSDNLLRLWRWKLGAVVLELPLADWPVRQVEFSNDGRRIVVLEHNRAKIYDSTPLEGHDSGISAKP